MRYWTIAFPGECGQHVQETWSEEQLLASSYYKHWVLKMTEYGKHEHITNENFIEDWCIIHWAMETDKFGRHLKEGEE